jgi:hypothetical protein
MDSSSGPGQSRSREANEPNWRLTLRHANKPKSVLPGQDGANRGDTQNTLKKARHKIRANAEEEEEKKKQH